jgi:hypothetical protein
MAIVLLMQEAVACSLGQIRSIFFPENHINISEGKLTRG